MQEIVSEYVVSTSIMFIWLRALLEVSNSYCQMFAIDPRVLLHHACRGVWWEFCTNVRYIFTNTNMFCTVPGILVSKKHHTEFELIYFFRNDPISNVDLDWGFIQQINCFMYAENTYLCTTLRNDQETSSINRNSIHNFLSFLSNCWKWTELVLGGRSSITVCNVQVHVNRSQKKGFLRTKKEKTIYFYIENKLNTLGLKLICIMP